MTVVKTKNYSTEEIEVVWNQQVCIHAAKCVQGLPNVFNPNKKPWINVREASTEALVQQIDQCPSGALSYRLKGKETSKPGSESKEIQAETVENGPLMVYGDVCVTSPDGKKTNRKKATAFCRCGASENKPFCDGMHKKIDFKG